jgi:tetratricopeptide (TPR) repeat protein
VALAVPLRLSLFSGYGLGDDGNFIAATIDFLEYGRLDASNYYHLRPLFVLPQALSFHLLGIGDLSLVLPTFIAAVGSHGLGVLVAGAVIGARGAAFVSVLWLTTPFESLTATAAAPDHILALALSGAVVCCLRGVGSRRTAWMVAGALLVLCGAAVKTPALGILPSFALATLLAGKRLPRWLPFWGTLALAGALAALALVSFAADAQGWLESLLARAWPNPSALRLETYPRLLLLRDPHGHFMFGAAGWLAVAGLLSAGLVRKSGTAPRAAAMVGLAGSYLAFFLYMAGSVEFPLIFRYLAQVTPALYLCGGFFVETLYPRSRVLALGVLALAAGFGLQQTLPVTEPSRDPNRDGRALVAFIEAERIAPNVTIQADYLTCSRLRWLLDPMSRGWQFRCPLLGTPEEKRRFLDDLESGYLITGGGTLAWYSTGRHTLTLEEAGVSPPKTDASSVSWELLFELDGPRRSWRREPLRVWRVVQPDGDRIIEIPDPALRACLRRLVFPGASGEDEDARPVTAELARHPRLVYCPDAGIRDARGLEAFVDTRELVLSHNQLRHVDLASMPRLRLALLNGNQLERVEGLESAGELESLWLSHNALDRLALGEKPLLRDLRADHNQLTRIRVDGRHPPLWRLVLWGNPDLTCADLPFAATLVAGSGCGLGSAMPIGKLPALDAATHHSYAGLLGTFGDPEDLGEAMAHAHAALALEPSGPGHDALGRLHARAGDHERALEEYERAIALDPSYFPAFQSRGDARLERGDRAGALRDYRRWAKLAQTASERAVAESVIRRVEAGD